MTRRTKIACTVLVAAFGLGLLGTTWFLAGSDQTPTNSPLTAIKRSMPDGKPDVIKAMGNPKWSNIE